MSSVVRSRPQFLGVVKQQFRQFLAVGPEISVETLALVEASFYTVFCNTAFFREVIA